MHQITLEEFREAIETLEILSLSSRDDVRRLISKAIKRVSSR